MKKFLPLLVLTACLTACHPQDDGVLTIVSYNVGACTKYMEDSAPLIADILSGLGANAVALCELDSATTRSGGRYQLEDIAAGMAERSGSAPWDFHFSPAFPFRGGAYGVGSAVSPRYKVLARYGITLPQSNGAEIRALSVLETDAFVLASTHLDYGTSEAQCLQAQVITDFIQEKFAGSGKAVFLCGDFNAAPDSEVLAQLTRDWTVLSKPDFSYASREPKICIDYICILNNGASWELVDTRLVDSNEYGCLQDASDHFPVYARIRIK